MIKALGTVLIDPDIVHKDYPSLRSRSSSNRDVLHMLGKSLVHDLNFLYDNGQIKPGDKVAYIMVTGDDTQKIKGFRDSEKKYGSHA